MAEQTERDKTKVNIIAPGDLLEKARDFAAAQDFPLERILFTHSPCRSAGADGPLDCSVETLYSGGRIACAAALSLADRLGVPGRKVGRLLDLLNIKVEHCSLGLFE